MRTLTRSSIAAAALLSVIALGGCSAIQGLIGGGGETVARDADTQEVTEGGTADVFTLRVGDCFDDTSADAKEISEVPAVPCDQPHDNEIYHEFTMPDGDFPGQEALDAAADEECAAEFDTFVGIAYADSVLDWAPFQPTEGSWTQLDDRVVQCIIYEYGVRVEGSLAGVAR
ncbi:septum formation family protein [Microbacterium sp. P05]|uniref:septum formation family protein n=1 Tax=Microbacterium sp. P05 TaxID=3366948 RepID=UPI0037450CC0